MNLYMRSLKLLAFLFLACLAMPASGQSSCDSACVLSGSRLASVGTSDSELLDPILSGLLGSEINLDVGDWNGLATGNVNLLEMLNVLQADLGLSSPDEALAAEVTLAQTIDAAAAVAQADGDLALANALNALSVPVSGANETIALSDLLLLDPNNGSLSDIEINALQLVSGLVQLYNFDNVVTTPEPIVLSGPEFDAIGVGSAMAYLQVVEPPQFVCGTQGTTFRSATVRAKLDLDLIGLSPDLGLLETALGIGTTADASLTDLTLYLDLASANGTIADVDYQSQTARLDLAPGLVDAYIGDIDDAVFFGSSGPILDADVGFADAGILDISTLGGLVNVSSGIEVRAVGQSSTFSVQSLLFSGPFPQTQTASNGALALAGLLDSLLNSLELRISGTLGPALDPLIAGTIVPLLQTAVSPVMEGVLVPLLGDTVDPILDLLGVGIGEAEATVLGISSLCNDFGDCPISGLAPDGVSNAAYGEAAHRLSRDLFLGSIPADGELVPISSADALGDDQDGIDDEDGATLSTFTAGENATISMKLNEPTVGTGYLQAWADWNGNGMFETTEQIASNLQAADGTGALDLSVPVPADVSLSSTFIRFRYSSTSGLGPEEPANDGEVEDYLVTISSADGPLICSDTFYMVATETTQNLPSLGALSISETGGTYTLSQSQLPPDYTGNYLVTGWGYNELDGYIYGVRQSPRSLMRINATGQVREVADLSTLGLESPDDSADVLPNGILVYMSGTNFGRYQLLDISDPANPVAVGVLDTGQPTIYGRDIAYNPRDGMLYFIDPNRDIYAIDAKGGTPGATTVTFVGNVPLPSGYFSIDMDSVWFDGSGFLYAFDNQSRQVFAVEVGSDGNRPASFSFIEVQGTVADLTYQGNDGASCRAPGPFVSSVFSEGSIAGTLYQDADGSGAYEAGETPLPAGIFVTLYNDNGSPADISDDALVATVETLSDGTYLFGTVDATLTYRVEVDVNDPEIPAGLTVSTPNPLTGITVATGSTTGGQDFGFAAAPASADLSLTKTVLNAASSQPASEAILGEELDFVLTVTNEGPGNTTGVTVRDLIPDGFAYVSDDATTQSDSYDSGTGLWTLGDVAAGSSHSLTIRVTMRDTGEHTNTAEITASDLPDPDSDPQTGILVDDLGDGIPDDDEASATVALSGTGATLSGTVFFDNGAGATAYDGLQEGSESGTDRATVQVFDAAGDLIDTPALTADGRWSLTLPAGYADAVTVTVQPGEGAYLVSEAHPALPSLSNPEPRDGSVTFTPEAAKRYEGINVGLITEARLNEDQQGVIRAGQVVALRHEYIAGAPGSVTFVIDNQDSNVGAGFSTAIYLDLSCDGTADQPITDALSVNADTVICIITRVSASAALSQGSYYAFDLLAVTTYDSVGISEEDRNRDRVTVEASQGTLSLSKTVRNVTQGTPEGVSNGAGAGDVLEYRIYLENTGTLPASDIQIFDRTPPYTVLAGPVPSPVTISGGVTCSIVSPTANSPGYSGDLRWECSGLYPAGAQGAVSFQVRVSP